MRVDALRLGAEKYDYVCKLSLCNSCSLHLSLPVPNRKNGIGARGKRKWAS